jgi:pimeloyl-ACP methyl ester carboxylesterase
MSNKISASDDYVNFRQSVPRKSAQIQGMTWKYYSVMESRSARELKAAPREVLVLLHSTSGTAESFFYQLLNLGCKGYPILACNIPAYKSPLAFARGLKAFLASLGFSRVHLCGVSLGGYLALQVAAYFPDLVSSLVLTNSFCDTLPFQRAGASCLGIMDYMPDFYVKVSILALTCVRAPCCLFVSLCLCVCVSINIFLTYVNARDSC